jgi:hypothetical protein
VYYAEVTTSDEDDASYKSCISANDTLLFDNADRARFPQGTLSYAINHPKFKPSWTMITYALNRLIPDVFTTRAVLAYSSDLYYNANLL